MATDSATRSVHNTLSAATADTVTITNDGQAIRIQNRSASATIYYTVGFNAATPATAVSAADNTYCLPPGMSDTLATTDLGSSVVVSLISSASCDYSVEAF